MNAALKSAFQSIVLYHLTRYPGLRVEDVYKLTFQAAMGSEHAVADADMVERRLKSEVRTLASAPDGAPLIDPVSPDHRLVRVNLRPYTDRGGDLAKLADAFIETSRVFKPSKAQLAVFWGWIEAFARSAVVPFTDGEVSDYGRRRQAEQYPAVHHSPAYRRLYRPAYRIVLKDRIVLPGR